MQGSPCWSEQELSLSLSKDRGSKMSSHWSLHLKGNCITRPISLYRKTCSSQISALLLCFFGWLYIWENWKYSSSPHGSFGLPTAAASRIPVCSLSFWCHVSSIRRPEICMLEAGVEGESVHLQTTHKIQRKSLDLMWEWCFLIHWH